MEARTSLKASCCALALGLALTAVLAPAASAAGGKRPKPAPSPTASTSPAPVVSPSPTASPAPVVAPTPTASPAPVATTRWTPRPGTSWQIQYTGTLSTAVDVSVYNVDGFDTPASTVAALRAAGRHVVCYISAGSYEDWRPDAAAFPASVLGRTNGWPGERWLDIRQLEVLKPILSNRMRMCRDKGFHAVDPDNVDGYTNVTGFPLTGSDQLVFNRWLATEAHALGLSIGLKNDLDQVPQLVDVFDFAVNEQCYQYSECAALSPFINAGKAVFHIEYTTSPASYCPTTTRLGLSSLLKNLDLSAPRQPC
jgi:hypothetical protein